MKRNAKSTLQSIVGILVLTVLILNSGVVYAQSGATSTTPTNITAIEPTPIIAVYDNTGSIPVEVKKSLNGIEIDSQKINTVTFDALLVSHDLFSQTILDQAIKSEILNLLDNQKMILVYDTSTEELSRNLDLKLPITRSENSEYAIVTILRAPDGMIISGGILVPKTDVIKQFKIDLATDIREKVANDIAFLKKYIDKRVSINSQGKANIVASAYWSSQGTISNTLDRCPYGKYNEWAIAQREENDGSSTYDFWTLNLEQQTLGGYDACSNTDYQTSRLWTRVDASNNSQALYRYGPTTTNANSTASVNIGITAGYKGASVSLGNSWSWTTSDVSVTDHSDFSSNWAEWELSYLPGSNAAKYTFLSEPGASIRTPQDGRLLIYRPINTYWGYWLGGEIHFWDYWWLEY
jgi:hypothetical protein